MSSTHVRVGSTINSVITILVQNVKDMTVLGGLDLTSINYSSNAGEVLAVLLRAAGLEWSDDGQRLWRAADPGTALKWRTPAAANSRRPCERVAPLDSTAGAASAHDADVARPGSWQICLGIRPYRTRLSLSASPDRNLH
jgi:hypothetical protein